MLNPSDEMPAKVTKAEAHYGLAKAGNADRCSGCKSFRPPNDCIKVEGRVAPAGWCRLGHSKADGHAFYGDEEKGEAPPDSEAQEMPQMGMGRGVVRPVPEANNSAVQGASPPMNAAALSHGRAIAGAKALHAVGHITAKERDKHIGASQKVISKRKAFGSWAP